MKYVPPVNGDTGDDDRGWPNADPSNGIEGAIPDGAAIEDPQRELVTLITKSGLTPNDADLAQVAKAVRSGRMNYRDAGGTANALTITLDPAPAAYSELVGMPLHIRITASNTSAATLNVNGLGTKSIRNPNGSELAENALPIYGIACAIYDGNVFYLSGILNNSPKPKRVLVYSSAGVSTFTAATGETYFEAEVWGAGGSGGGTTGGLGSVSMGGAGGGYSWGFFALTALQSFSVTVGAGGVASLVYGTGTAGGTSSVGSFLSATGGTAGAPSTGGVISTATTGGTGAGGQVNYTGIAAQPGATWTGGTLLSIGGASGFGGGFGPVHIFASGGGTNNASQVGMGGNGATGDGQVGGNGRDGLVIIRTY